MMLQEAVENYIASLSARAPEHRGNNRNTILAYRNDLGQLCSYLSGENIQDWAQVTREHISDYLVKMSEAYSYRPTTVARKLAAFKSFFRFLRGSDIIEVDPVEKLTSPRIQKDLPQVLSAEQVSSLFHLVDGETVGGQRDLAMLRLLYSTGMRASELVSLNVDDFDPTNSVIVCPGGGSARRERVLPLSAIAREALCQYLERSRPRLLRREGEPALFLNHHGERLTRQGFWLIIKGYARQAGITDITPHSLRHSFAILMLKEGMELRSIKELLGHAHISTTQMYCQMALAETSRQG
ncbi:MAG: tyrosine-type recombinase/integrase [Ktedonobacteraceae bacterium]|nr:tyrosine-type recombinase/integrase [Ktedonobacteraceae bacterium]MBO0791436.1 tyrosine-type recombinase/integrase [Ktedonobacteraceae bacterium]